MKRKTLWIVGGMSLAVAGMLALASPASAFGPPGGMAGPGGPGGFGGPGHGAGGFGPGAGAERGTLLAEELGISVEALKAARDRAMAKGLEQAVAEGRLTREQADLMLAGKALRDFIDPLALTAEALGISVEELQAAFDEGKRLHDLLEELGIAPQDFRDAMQAAHEAAVARAVAEGVLTQAQADALAEARGRRGPGGMRGGPGGMRGGPGDPGAGVGQPGEPRQRGVGRGQGPLGLTGDEV